jgi:hypothetical protein
MLYKINTEEYDKNKQFIWRNTKWLSHTYQRFPA